MTSRTARLVSMSAAAVAVSSAAIVLSGQIAPRSFRTAAPSFTDPERRAKLARAFPEIDRIATEFVATAHVPGAAWGVIVDGDLAHVGTTGYRDVEAKAPVDADTVFRIASMTKSFTAVSILKLRDEGRLSLDDPAEKHVPEMKNLVYPTADSPRITVRQLLSHAEGFPEDNPWGDRQLEDSDGQLSEMLTKGIPFSRTPGLEYEYSNLGFAILGRIVTNVSKTRYPQYVTANILEPLGLTSTTLDMTAVPRSKLALGYRWEDERGTLEPMLKHGSFGSMGGMLTSIRDLSRYVSMFLAAWPPSDARETLPIKRSSLREMQQLWNPAPAVVTRSTDGRLQMTAGGYGYGLNVSQTCDFRRFIAHGGGLPGFGSTMRWLPDYGVGFIALGNVTYTSWGRPSNAVFDALLRTGGLQPRTIPASPALVSARDAVARLVVAWDERTAERVAAENLFLDRSKARRRAELDALHGQVGTCRAEATDFDVENALRGAWTQQCERGAIRVSITLAPTEPPSVQMMAVRAAELDRLSTAACVP